MKISQLVTGCLLTIYLPNETTDKKEIITCIVRVA